MDTKRLETGLFLLAIAWVLMNIRESRWLMRQFAQRVASAGEADIIAAL